jgi:outer membrane protein TolC
MRFSKFSLAGTMLVLFLYGSVIPVSAATDLPTDRPLNLQDCIQYALSHHGSVLSSEQNVAGARAGVRQAQSGYLPKVTLNSGYSSNGIVVTGSQTASATGNSSGVATYADVTETLWNGGQTQAAVKEAVANVKASNASLTQTQQAQVLTVTEAYFTALLNRRLADIAVKTVNQSQEQVKQIKAQVAAGASAKSDELPVDVVLANAQLSKIQADNNVRIADSALRDAMGLDEGPALQLVDVKETKTEVPTLDESMKYALENRPEIVGANAQIESARAALALAKSQLYPVPTVDASYDVGIGGVNYANQWVVGAGLVLNVFDGGAAKAAYDVDKAKLKANIILAEQTKKDVANNVQQAYLNLTSATEQLKAAQTSELAAKTNLEVNQAKYQQGLAIPLDVATALTSYSSAQTTSAQALYNIYNAQAQFDQAIGKRGY